MLKYVRLFRLKTTLIYLFPLVLALSVGLEQIDQGAVRPIPASWVLVSLPAWAAERETAPRERKPLADIAFAREWGTPHAA